jgi:predicted  nucleic acid-binding Zn-ribbon protein
MSTPEDYERLRALLEALQAQLAALQREREPVRDTLRRLEGEVEKSLRESKLTDRLNRAEAKLADAEKSGATYEMHRAIAHAVLAIAFELRELRRKDQDAS